MVDMAKVELGGERFVVEKPKARKLASKSHDQIFDAALTTLFANSLGPVKPIARSFRRQAFTRENTGSIKSVRGSNEAEITEHEASSEASNEQESGGHSLLSNKMGAAKYYTLSEARPNRKRKRNEIEDDLEGRYMSSLAKQEIKEEIQARATQKQSRKHKRSDSADEDDASSGAQDRSASESVGTVGEGEAENPTRDIPQHESLIDVKNGADLEQSSRTVFLANVSTLAIKSKPARKMLFDHLASFVSTLPRQDFKHGIDSLRFRSTAFASTGVPRKAAFAKKDLMDTTTKSTNAYAVYTTQLAAREAAKRLNGTMVLDRHLRVDSVAHPAIIDHRRCVFVGNLGFVDDASNINAAEDEVNNKRPRKAKEPADVEEGLWRQFGKAGAVESVRVVRDKTTRVGKGFAYVQFENANAVETALLYNGKKFPPMLPRMLRVTRAKNVRKAAVHRETTIKHKNNGGSASSYKPKVPSQVQSWTGRGAKLLGRAGAAQLRAAGERQSLATTKFNGVAKTPGAIVFEGHRASSHQRKETQKTGGSGKKHGKPSTRSRQFKAQSKKKS